VDPGEWAILRTVIDLIQANAKGAELGPVLETIENAKNANGAELLPVLETIENALRADQAKLIAD
jgi:hypothetical protein